MACALSAKLRHLGDSPIIHHEMDIAHAKAGSTELDKHIVRTRNGDIDVLDFLNDVRLFDD